MKLRTLLTILFLIAGTFDTSAKRIGENEIAENDVVNESQTTHRDNDRHLQVNTTEPADDAMTMTEEDEEIDPVVAEASEECMKKFTSLMMLGNVTGASSEFLKCTIAKSVEVLAILDSNGDVEEKETEVDSSGANEEEETEVDSSGADEEEETEVDSSGADEEEETEVDSSGADEEEETEVDSSGADEEEETEVDSSGADEEEETEAPMESAANTVTGSFISAVFLVIAAVFAFSLLLLILKAKKGVKDVGDGKEEQKFECDDNKK